MADPGSPDSIGSSDSETTEPKSPVVHVLSAGTRLSGLLRKSPQATTSTCSSSSSEGEVSVPSYRWHPSFFRLRPFLGFAALGLILTCLCSSLAILVSSNGRPTKDWSFAPSVYLAIATAVSNTAVRFALAQAVPISWWYKAFKGSTIRDLELAWEAGQGFPRAVVECLKQRRALTLLTFAGIATGVVMVDGPLLQRASSVNRVTRSGNTTMTIPISPELPRGFAGGFFIESYLVSGETQSPAAEAIGIEFTEGMPITSAATCDGSCTAIVQGPGLVPHGCSSTSVPVNKSMIQDPDADWGIPLSPNEPPGLMPNTPVLFTYMWNPAWQRHVYAVVPPVVRETIRVSTGFMQTRDWEGTFTLRTCDFLPGTLEYTVMIQGQAITFVGPVSSIPVISVANNSYLHMDIHTVQNITVATLLNLVFPFVTANVTVATGPAYQTSNMNSWAIQYIHGEVDYSTVVVKDPMDDIIARMNELMFRAGIATAPWKNVTDLIAPGLSVNQTVRAKQTLDENIYQSNLRWFYGAATVQILARLIIAPTFWGYWLLGMDLTLSPFQAAKMMDARLLDDVNSAGGATGVTEKMGDTKVKLGVVEVRNRRRHGQSGEDAVASGSRIGIAHPHQVVIPLVGATVSH